MTKEEIKKEFFNKLLRFGFSDIEINESWNLAKNYWCFVEEPKVNYKLIHSDLQACLLKYYGKKQVKGFGDKYFIPNSLQLQEFLERFWKKYPNYTNIEKIEKILLKFVEKCAKNNKFAPTVYYFIGKSTNDGYVSLLADAYENWEDEQNEKVEMPKQNTDFTVNI